jgi:iron-sulfur cluster assembly protein
MIRRVGIPHGGFVGTTQRDQAAIQLSLTPDAAEQVRKVFEAEQAPATAGLRVGVMPGGCSGFKYEMSIDEAPIDDDVILDVSGVRVFVDPFSAQYLNGVSIDYVQTMQSAGFAFDNPNATGGCGCGTSFSV